MGLGCTYKARASVGNCKPIPAHARVTARRFEERTIKSIDFDRCAVVGYKDDTGIGRQCHNIKRVLGIRRHLVAPSTRLPGYPICAPNEQVLSHSASIQELTLLLSDLDALFVIERNKWHPNLFKLAKELGLALFLIPNWEWFDSSDGAYALVDRFIVHSKFALRFMQAKGFPNTSRVDVPIDLSLLPARTVTSLPTLFLHNAGIIDSTDRKGTLLTIAAWARKKPSDASLVVRFQKSDIPLPNICGMHNIAFERMNTPNVGDLYEVGDFAIQPSRLEGLGFMIFEPLLCGIPTLVADAPPMNELKSGTVFCQGMYSMTQSIPVTRGIGLAQLFDINIDNLACLIEQLEATNVQTLSLSALEFRKRHSPSVIRREWLALREGTQLL